jgi:hypothetical protein
MIELRTYTTIYCRVTTRCMKLIAGCACGEEHATDLVLMFGHHFESLVQGSCHTKMFATGRALRLVLARAQ